MYLFDIVRTPTGTTQRFKVKGLSRTNSKDDSEVKQYLSKLKESEARGLLVLFDLFAESGLEHLSYTTFHCVDSDLKLYEFIKGRHRVVCFFEDSETIIVCTHCFLKRTQKTPQEEKLKADRIRNRYLSAKDAGELQIIVDDKTDEHI